MTRSQGSSHLADYQEDIGKFERANKKKKKIDEQREAEMAEYDAAGNLLNEDGLPLGGDHQGVFQDPPPPRNNNAPAAGEQAAVARAAAERDTAANAARLAAANARPAPARQTLRDHDAPNVVHFRDKNRQLPINRNDFEIKTGLLSLVKQNQFHGLTSENPVYHLDNFEDICSTIRMNGHGTESFHEAWERFKDYYRECPHHGYPYATLINTFYRGVNKEYKMALDTSSNGDFMTKTEEKATELIENMAASNSSHNVDYDRSYRGGGGESKQIAELTAKVEQLLKRDQRAVNCCEDSGKGPVHQEFNGDGSDDLQAELNFVNGYGNYQNRGFNQNYRNHPNLSYRSTNVENPQDQVYPTQAGSQGQQFQPSHGFQTKGSYQGQFQPPAGTTHVSTSGDNEMKLMMQQILEGQKKNAAEINVKVDSMYNDLNGKFTTLSSHVKTLESQGAQIASASTRPTGAHPGKVEPKGKEHCYAIMIQEESREIDVAKQEEAKAIVVDTSVEDKIGKVDEPLYVEPPSYVPKIPFPGRERQIQKQKEYARFDEIMRHLYVRLPFLKLVLHLPTFKSYLKDVLSNKKSIEEGVMLIYKSKEYVQLEESHRQQVKVQLTDVVEVVAGKVMVSTSSVILPVTIPEKLDDPGSFVLPYRIGKSVFERCLYDLGASVNLMLLSVSKRLGITDFKPSRISLILADRSVRYQVGLAEDVHVRVGNFYIRTDFTVLELDKEPQDPLILGRPFLNTGGAIIDVRRSKINLQIGDYSLEFDMRERRKNPTIDGQAFSIDTNDESSDKCVKKCSGWSEVKEVLDGDSHIPIKKIADKDMVKQKRIKGDPHIALIPLRCVGDTIEYKVQCKGTSKPFSKARSILTSEWKEKGRKVVKSVVGKALKLKLYIWGPCFGASSRTRTH
ncbi:hypothetical protein ISN45_Aa05g009320 [Arabidopsis thaliana x Arabidopsis arenosa]|uniref:Retrotransposon gag domain-containing protein n=1 Tax=Arabidopsis thaliana x Arabidopsis arenosa TaxID=1240361 RepID=A0A8T1ZLJ2_9BRAS|nr:hypothetical protein ISN45_Aa05g009320 [Arabidopsis thaliana x Arabidopsis arenosa]